ncbi:unnamed protein product [Blepharisma stoltei]|uniref:Vacuolar protein sorting-associated protein 54 C-terminal domain-containing protein n=1 Tax=Blepharisma stoltei TaxID=1481888 RepID=A0AAU9ITR6_9CILI|nr:unnamed protein product [Blepharisma stoltei]
MEPQLSRRSSASISGSSCNTSFEHILMHPSEFRNSYQIRTSQSLSSINNDPESSFIGSVYNLVSKTLTINPDPSPFLEEVSEEEFQPYLNKIMPLLHEKMEQDSLGITSRLEEYTPEKCYELVPEEFFDPKFRAERHLEERSIDYQETLISLLDMADVSIFHKISDRWEEFMNAADNLQGLNSQVTDMIQSLESIFQANEQLLKNLLIKSIKAYRLQRRLENIKKVEERIGLIAVVKETQPTVQQLLSIAQYSSATQLIIKTQQTLNSKLKGVKAVRHQEQTLNEIKQLVDKLLDDEFQHVIIEDILNKVFEQTDKLVKMLKSSQGEDNLAKLIPKDLDKLRLESLVDNKIHSGTLQQSLETLTDLLVKDMKINLVKLIGQLGVIKTDESSKWLNISHPHLLIVFKAFYYVFQATLQRLSIFGTIVLNKLGANGDMSYYDLKQVLYSQTNSRQIISDLNQFETTLAGLFFSKYTKILRIRSESIKSLNLLELCQLYEQIEKLSSAWKNFSNQQSNSALASFLQHEKDYISAFHEKKIGELSALLEGETWAKVDVPEDMLQIIMSHRSESARIGGMRLETPDFSATACLLMFYKIIYEYVKMCEELQIPNEIGSRMVEMLKFYNSKTFHLIASAGATQFRLKKITSKHLGLSVQGITFILEELPYIEMRLSSKIKDYDTLLSPEIQSAKDDYNAHLKEVYNKITRIITERVTKKCQEATKDAKWEMMISPNQTDKDYYINQIISDVSSMNSILCTVLNASQMQIVFGQIFSSIQESLINLYGSIVIDSYTPAQRVKNDMQKLVMSLREKLGSSSIQEFIEDLEERLQKFVADKCQAYLNV